VRLTTLPPSVRRFGIQRGFLDISQPYSYPRPVAEIALLLLTLNVYEANRIQSDSVGFNESLPCCESP
jgi:hypothetical protein